eukprot:6546612-Prymnesium_polylepis.1
MQRASRADSGQTARKAAGRPAVGNAQRAVFGGSAPLLAEPRADLEDVAVWTSLCRRFRRWGAPRDRVLATSVLD